ncbi:MAG TPA: DUF4404 family protein [Pirellulales bacterium]|nr:DUF4404 family protein [Pirellulales bacterium]
MNDDRIRLRRLIDAVRTQLAASPSVEDDLRAGLEQTLAEAEAALSDGGAAPPAGEPLGQRLSKAAIDFEVNHPTLAAEVSSVIDALGRMGI